VPSFDLPGVLRRIRRQADLSQRDLARATDTSKSTLAAAETGRIGFDARLLARAAAVAGLRLTLLDGDGAEVAGMSPDAVRDMGGRRFPAHLDTRYGDEAWWHGTERYSRTQPWYTFDRLRYTRDYWRGRQGTPDDHQLPQPGDSPAARLEARRRAARERRQNAPPPAIELWVCTCPPLCDELDDRTSKPVHAPQCTCDCDVA
jgi:transcriptional regulator with XRE-family HTH domain